MNQRNSLLVKSNRSAGGTNSVKKDPTVAGRIDMK
jgi:hypothetical protein